MIYASPWWWGTRRISRFALVQVFLYIILAERDTGRASVNHHSEGFAMGFAPGAYSKNFSEN